MQSLGIQSLKCQLHSVTISAKSQMSSISAKSQMSAPQCPPVSFAPQCPPVSFETLHPMSAPQCPPVCSPLPSLSLPHTHSFPPSLPLSTEARTSRALIACACQWPQKHFAETPTANENLKTLLMAGQISQRVSQIQTILHGVITQLQLVAPTNYIRGFLHLRDLKICLRLLRLGNEKKK